MWGVVGECQSPSLVTADHYRALSRLPHPQHNNHPLPAVCAVVIYIFSAVIWIFLHYIKADDGDKCGHEPPRLQIGALYRTEVGLHSPGTSQYCLRVSLYSHVITNTCSRGVAFRPQLRGIARDWLVTCKQYEVWRPFSLYSRMLLISAQPAQPRPAQADTK